MYGLSRRQQFGILLVALLGVSTLVIFGSLYWLVSRDEASTKSYHAGVVTNGYECAQIGGDILRKGGSAADAAIAAMFCEGIAMPQSCGLGGGFVMTMYQKNTTAVRTLIAREVAPKNAHENMFENVSSIEGGLAIAVPGELKGYWELHQQYGKLPWRELVQPTIDLCKTGIFVTPYLQNLFSITEDRIRGHYSLAEVFINPATNKIYVHGERVKRLKLASFLEDVAKYGPDVLYDGKYTKEFVREINDYGGNMTMEDLKNYKPIWKDPAIGYLPNDDVLYTTPLPASGPVLTFIINILNGFIDRSAPYSIPNWQRVIESFKYGYARRTEMGDPDFIDINDLLANITSVDYAAAIRSQIFDNMTFDDPAHYGANFSSVDDHGTANICVLAPNGDAIVLTSTINLYFGSKRRSMSTGIILNDEMDDFSTPNKTNDFGIPPSPANYIVSGKTPMSSMSPAIVIDKNGDIKMLVGAAGGSKITTSIAFVILQHLVFNKTIEDALKEPRLHHQLIPMAAAFEHNFDTKIIEGLKKIGHVTEQNDDSGFSALTAMSLKNGIVSAGTDIRRSGSIDLL